MRFDYLPFNAMTLYYRLPLRLPCRYNYAPPPQTALLTYVLPCTGVVVPITGISFHTSNIKF